MHPAALAGFCSELEKLGALKPSIGLQAHQESAVEQSHTSPGMILNWGLGSGKTIGSMAVAEEKGGNVLVVVPASLRENYKKQLRQAVTPDRHKHYTVISYNAFRADPEGWVAKVRPTTLVTDEVHRLRNAAPREPFERVRSKIPFMLGLTGSLVNNDPEEIVPLTNLVAGKQVFKSTEDFDRRFVGQTKVQPGLWARLRGARAGTQPHIQNEEALGSILRPFIHRFSGDTEYQKHVPQVTEKRVEVEMTPRQEDMLKSLQKSNPTLDYKIRHNLPPSKSELKNLNAFMTGARQISNNPQAFSVQRTPSPKLEQMFHDLREEARKDPNFKAVVYSNFLESGISPLIDQLHHQGVPAESFTGGLNDDQRKKIVDRFNKGHLRVLGLSPAGGEGLDLKGVKMVQLTEEHWNPERTRQAVGRSARYKSHDALPPEERRVQVNRYLAVHPEPNFFARLFGAKRPMSPDEWIDERRREKLQLNQSVMNAIPQFQRKAASVNMMTAFADELQKLGGYGPNDLGGLGGIAAGMSTGRNLAGDTAAEIAPHGRKTRSESMARALGWIGAPAGGLAALALAHKLHLGKHVTNQLMKHLPAEAAVAAGALSHGAAGMAGASVGGLATGAGVGLAQKLRGEPKGWENRKHGEDKAAVSKDMVNEAVLGRLARTHPGLKAKILSKLFSPIRALGGLPSIFGKGIEKAGPHELQEIRNVQKANPKLAVAFEDELGKLGGDGTLKSDVKAKYKRPVGRMPGVKQKANPFPKQAEEDKTAITHGKVIRAIFQRAYQGKQVTPTIHRMADTFSSTAERMGSTPTREGLKKWITQVKDTGKI